MTENLITFLGVRHALGLIRFLGLVLATETNFPSLWEGLGEGLRRV